VRRDSEPSISPNAMPGKPLKHKKSGFMRMFNAKDREAVPPVPTLADEYTAHNNSQPSTVAKIPKTSPSRVPVPTSWPSSINESPSSASSLSNISDYEPSAQGRRANLSPKRTPPPPLHIQSSPHSTRPFVTGSHTLPTPTPKKSDKAEGATLSAPPSTSDFPSLSLRPVSTVFSAHFADIVLPGVTSPVEEDRSLDTPSSTSPGMGLSPLSPSFPLRSDGSSGDRAAVAVVGAEDQSSVIRALQDQIVLARKAWQRHIWELEGQVRDLKAEVDDLRSTGNAMQYCGVCGRGKPEEDGHPDTKKVGVVNRPRARTGDSARFASGN